MLPFVYLIDATACRCTHHRMALDGLLLLNCRHVKRWQRIILKHYDDFLDGAIAPDVRFRDFQNHVLYVEEENWGGATDTAVEWYETTIEAAQQQAWKNLAFSAGVLSHYVTDPIHPFHTRKSEEATNIQRAFDWSMSKAYRRLRSVADVLQDTNFFELPEGEEWLPEALIHGARHASDSVDGLVKHYDFNVGVAHPVDALDDYCSRKVSEHLRYATRLFGQILSRAFESIEVMPPLVHLHPEAIVATSKAPVRWARRGVLDVQTRIEVGRMHDEWERTGRVQNQLGDDSRAVRSALDEAA